MVTLSRLLWLYPYNRYLIGEDLGLGCRAISPARQIKRLRMANRGAQRAQLDRLDLHPTGPRRASLRLRQNVVEREGVLVAPVVSSATRVRKEAVLTTSRHRFQSP